jgi:hypothetical protein
MVSDNRGSLYFLFQYFFGHVSLGSNKFYSRQKLTPLPSRYAYGFAAEVFVICGMGRFCIASLSEWFREASCCELYRFSSSGLSRCSLGHPAAKISSLHAHGDES